MTHRVHAVALLQQTERFANDFTRGKIKTAIWTFSLKNAH